MNKMIVEETTEQNSEQWIWSNKDLRKHCMVAFGFGIFVGTLIGYEWAWRPVVDCARYLVG